MSLSSLQEKISQKQALMAIIGLGYVGLPVACEFAAAGFNVLGVDLNQERVEKVNAAISPLDGTEPGLPELLSEMVAAQRLKATSDYDAIRDRDVILICVETPVDESYVPQYSALRSAISDLGRVLKPGSLVILESTVSPGTMVELVLPLLESSSGKKVSEDFWLGICPERVMPGKLLANLRNVNRVVGGMTPETAETMAVLYRQVVHADLDITDCVTAELVKTVENAYRDVQIAFANEIALICEAVGGNVWVVRNLVNKSPGRSMLFPGAGVGGHCIPKDPWLLVYGVAGKDVPLRIIPAARDVNNAMPIHVADLVARALDSQGRKINDARILVLGYSYLEESGDTRNSPSASLVSHLVESGAELRVHDPFVPQYQGSPESMVDGCDAVVVMVKHKFYQTLDLAAMMSCMRTPVLVDARHALDPVAVKHAGFSYWVLGMDALGA